MMIICIPCDPNLISTIKHRKIRHARTQKREEKAINWIGERKGGTGHAK